MYNEEVKKVLVRFPVSLLEEIDKKVGVYPYCTRTDAIHYLLKEGLIYQEKKKEIKKLLKSNQGVQMASYEDEVLRYHFEATHDEP